MRHGVDVQPRARVPPSRPSSRSTTTSPSSQRSWAPWPEPATFSSGHLFTSTRRRQLAQHCPRGTCFPRRKRQARLTMFHPRFNFELCLERDQRENNSTRLLTESVFEFKRREGIDPNEFAQLFTTSGLALAENATWLTGRAYLPLWNTRLVFACCPDPSYNMAD